MPSKCNIVFLKGLLAAGYERRDAGSLMVEVCETLASRLESGAYDQLVSTVPEPWKDLQKASRRPKDSVLGEDMVSKTKALRMFSFGLVQSHEDLDTL